MIDSQTSASADSKMDLAVENASAPFMGQWRHLVSTTNWEKGRIIHDWRQALVSAKAPAAEYADEAWSRRVGGVSGQHVGRLRRVFERFGSSHDDFAGLFWSHFQAALEWDDAEMWLEGAVRSDWSVAEMRRQRVETRGAVEGAEIADEPDGGELDEDFSDEASDEMSRAPAASSEASALRSRSPADAEEDDADANDGDESPAAADDSSPDSDVAEPRAAPFAHLEELPPDMAEAFEAFKLAIVRHRLARWSDVRREDVLAALAALGELALAPVD